jgi:hypothetical protein
VQIIIARLLLLVRLHLTIWQCERQTRRAEARIKASWKQQDQTRAWLAKDEKRLSAVFIGLERQNVNAALADWERSGFEVLRLCALETQFLETARFHLKHEWRTASLGKLNIWLETARSIANSYKLRPARN